MSEGQPVEMELSYLPGKTYTGRVSYIYPYLREKARDVHVRLIFSNPGLDLKPGMYANVELQGKVIPDALVVPSEAVIRSGARALVFVVRGDEFDGKEFRFNDLELTTDKAEYRAGDVVRLMINTDRPGGTVALFLRPVNGVYAPPKILRSGAPAGCRIGNRYAPVWA